jgi:hypothetical protein
MMPPATNKDALHGVTPNMKTLFSFIAMLLITISGCNKKDVSAVKDYTSIVCKTHNERVYRREYRGAIVEYTKAYGQFLHSDDWRAKYPYAIIDSNEDIHAEDATNKFLYHLVCDECQKEFQQDYKSFDFDSEELKFRVVLDDAGKPLVEDCKVTLDQLEVMLVNARKKQPGVDVTIVMPEGLPFKHMRIIQHLASKAGITYINFNFIKNSEIKSE